jgi:hypothetical protein
VLPFHGLLDFAGEAMQSLVAQEHADVVVHLIDDASPESTDSFLRYWSSHPQVRVYRNLENLGQFTSFNNVSKFFETDLVAVQDADDVSLPHRISSGGEVLRLSGADFYGAAVELFGNGDSHSAVPDHTSSPDSAPDGSIRRSFHPSKHSQHFVKNPTAMFRVAMFRRLGGFADFGDALANRTGLDTEFQQRCLYSGVDFAISRMAVVRYRIHHGSATNNNLTGWGSPARVRANCQIAQRVRIYQNAHRIEPRLFGAIGRHQHLTRRLSDW